MHRQRSYQNNPIKSLADYTVVHQTGSYCNNRKDVVIGVLLRVVRADGFPVVIAQRSEYCQLK